MDWVEHSVWTERMLTALQEGVKGGVWYSLVDKVWKRENLGAAFTKVAANKGAPGVDHVTIEVYQQNLDRRLSALTKTLQEGTYRPQRIRRVEIDKPGTNEKRPLGIPTVQDRMVQGAIRHVVEPIFEQQFAEQSYGFRPERGCKDALRRVNQLLEKGYTHVVDADLKSYFDTIPHEPLMARVGESIADGRLLALIEAFLKTGIMDGLRTWTPEAGAPQGAVLSPMLSNIYLNPLDHEMARRGYEMVRYADDFVILCRSVEEAEQALAEVRRWTAQAELTLHPTKTKIVNARTDGFAFLGYLFKDGKRRPRDKSLNRLKDTIRAKTKRTCGHALRVVIGNVNRTLRGWFEYFKHSQHRTFPTLDSWIRMRLRSILRRRRHRRGCGRGADHQRWPNAYFAKQGLFNLEQAFVRACQASRR